MKKIVRYCVNPKCTTGTEENMRPTSITPANALYKPEGGVGGNVCIFAPKTFGSRYFWPKKFYYKEKDNNLGTVTYKVDIKKVYCPSCNEPINVECDPFRIVIIGPTSCGKTVYLTVLNDMLTQKSDEQPMYFEKIGGKGNFNFKHRDGKFYLPEATNLESFDYMIYDCLKNPEGESIFDYVKEKNNINLKSNIELAFYDLSGEYFQEGDIEKAEDRYIKLAQLDHADLVLVVIDCDTILGKNESRKDFTFSKFINDYLAPLKKRNDKDLCLAVCYLASDKLDKDFYGGTWGNSIDLRKDERLYTADGFDINKCKKHIDKVYKAFVADKRYSNPAIRKLVEDGTFIPGQTLGLFAISAIGDQKIIEENGEKYIVDFNSRYSWNVLAPIHWFLSQKGYVKTLSESK